jgi:hypothetical protein
VNNARAALADRPDRKTVVGITLLLMIVVLLHTALVWGYTGPFTGDLGRWFHEVDRLSHGEVLYRDFVWPFPPLALWLLGAVARMCGAGTGPIWVATSIVALLIMFVYVRLVAFVVSRQFFGLTVFAGAILALAFANYESPPLPMGTYTPASPIGLLFLLLAAVLTLEPEPAPSPGRAVLAGSLCGLAVLCKQDFWIPALYLTAVQLVSREDIADRARRRNAALALGGLVGVVLLGVLVVARQAGWAAVAGAAGGFGSAAESGGRGLPSWERLTVELWGIGILLSVLLASLRIGRTITAAEFRPWFALSALVAVAAGAVYLLVGGHAATSLTSFTAGPATGPGPGVGAALHNMRLSLSARLFPALLPPLVAIVTVVRWKHLEQDSRRGLLLALAGLCVALRSKRLFEHVEWYNVLLEVPLYVLAVQVLVPRFDRRSWNGMVVALTVLLLIGVNEYHKQSKGPLTNRIYPKVQTARGIVRFRPNEAREFVGLKGLLDSVDPAGRRPLFAFGRSGGFNYFLGRDNPTPLTHGFRISNASPDAVVTSLRNGAHPLLVDVADEVFQLGVRPEPGIFLTRWQAPTRPSHYLSYDRRFFEAAVAGCIRVGQVPPQGKALYTVYDCNDGALAGP